MQGDNLGEFTYIAPNANSVIDWAITDVMTINEIIKNFKVIPRTESKHNIIEIMLTRTKLKQKDPISYSKQQIIWSSELKEVFTTKLEKLIAKTYKKGNIQMTYEDILTLITKTANKFNLIKEVKVSNCLKTEYPEWFNLECQKYRKEVKSELKKFRKSNLETDRDRYCQMRKQYAQLKRKTKDEYLAKQNQEIIEAKDSKEFWKLINKLKKRTYNENPITIDVWEQHFVELLGKKSETIISDRPYLIDSDETLDSPITDTEIIENIKSLKVGKATGPDLIPNEILKGVKNTLLEPIKQLFNDLIKSNNFPEQWMEGTIVTIFKKGNPNTPANYRPITLFNTIPKLLSTILAKRLQKWQKLNQIIPREQAGFQKGKSCQDQIFILNALLTNHVKLKKKKIYAAFIHLTAAFDSIVHEVLWEQLKIQGVSKKFINTVKALYENAKVKVLINGKYTKNIKINKGVLQGEPLSPSLFNAFLFDIVTNLKKENINAVTLGNTEVDLLLYADDIVVLADTKIDLQRKLNVLSNYFNKLHLKINNDKTKIVVFRNGGNLKKTDKWFINGKEIQVVNNFTYLGVRFESISILTNVEKIFKSKARVALSAIWKPLITLKIQKMKVRVKLFEALVRSTLFYCLPVWLNINKNKIETIQNLFYKKLFNLHREIPSCIIHREMQINSLEVKAMEYILNYWGKILTEDENSLLYQAYITLLNDKKTNNWATNLQKKLNHLGFGYLWLNQSVEELIIIKPIIIERLKDQNLQQDNAKINTLIKYNHYKEITKDEQNFNINEKNLPLKIIRLFLQLRTNLSPYKMDNSVITPLNDKPCLLCNVQSDKQENLYHMWFICPFYKHIRELENYKHIPVKINQNLLLKTLHRLTRPQMFQFYNIWRMLFVTRERYIALSEMNEC